MKEIEKILVVKIINEKGDVVFTHYAKPVVEDFIGGSKSYTVPESLIPRLKAVACDGVIWSGVEQVEELTCFGNDTRRFVLTPDKVFTESNPFFCEQGQSDECWEIIIKAVDLYC